jgi:hypothetical protein
MLSRFDSSFLERVFPLVNGCLHTGGWAWGAMEPVPNNSFFAHLFSLDLLNNLAI